MPRGPRSPGFAPPDWPRLGRRLDASPAVGGLAPPPTDIPLLWLSQPIAFRPDPPYNDAEVSGPTATARARDRASVDEFGSNPFTASLSTVLPDDAANLASWTVDQRSTPRMRCPQLTINLLYRTDDEIRLLLGIRRNRRIRITGVPANWPEGADSLIVAGITHELGVAVRLMHITTRAIVGTTAGVPGPWFRLGSSALGGSDLVPF